MASLTEEERKEHRRISLHKTYEKRKLQPGYKEKVARQRRQNYLNNYERERAKSKKHYEENKEHYRDLGLKRYYSRRARAIEMLGGDACVFCGRVSYGKMSFHEIYGRRHKKDATKLVLEGSQDFVYLHEGCHKTVHDMMNYLGLEWAAIMKMRERFLLKHPG